MPISKIRVPNKGNPSSKIWCLGESPGEIEEDKGEPFVGTAGQILRNTLNHFKVSIDDVFLCNLCQYRPPGNKFYNLKGSSQLKEGIKEIEDLLKSHSPNVIAVLGNEPLEFVSGKRRLISEWRGSFIDYQGHKCVATYHPAYIARNPGESFYFTADFRRIVKESSSPEIPWPKYKFDLEGRKTIDFLLSQPHLDCDIENIRDTNEITCIGFAWSEEESVVFDFRNFDHRVTIKEVLENHPSISFHFGYHDVLILHTHNIIIKSWIGDTFLQSQVIAPELPRDLGFLASIYTNQPAYKTEGRGTIPGDEKAWKPNSPREDHFTYNSKDCCVTYKAEIEQNKIIENDPYFAHTYKSRIALAPRLVKLSENGLPIDLEEKKRLSKEFEEDIKNLYRVYWHVIEAALGERKLVNVRSVKIQDLLYKDLGLPIKKKKDKKTNEEKVTADDDALVSLIGFCQNRIDSLATEKKKTEWGLKLAIVKGTQAIRGLQKEKSTYIDAGVSEDGRMRSRYKQSTETGRLACNKWYDDTGVNASTFPRKGKSKRIVKAREGNILIWLDYSQIESWMTSHLAREFTMINMLKTTDIHKETASVFFSKKIEDIVFEERYIGKKNNHSLSYGEGPYQLMVSINKDGIITVALHTTKTWHRQWHNLFPGIKVWWEDVYGELMSNGKTIVNPYGTKRQFHNPYEDRLRKELYAHVPQSTAADHCLGTVHPELDIEGGLIKLIDKFPDFVINTAYDSAGMEVPYNIHKEIMEEAYNIMLRPCVINGMEFTVPIDIEIGERWSDLEEVKL